ncbi:hypothetical protein [Methanofollis fontis]|uniref:hypothetical protein n=1 Tax=Methanofollis fontis TaxID=2052832 RepID=UPI001A92F625|nr:hypothetical protein [Methanofollis fontis]
MDDKEKSRIIRPQILKNPALNIQITNNHKNGEQSIGTESADGEIDEAERGFWW